MNISELDFSLILSILALIEITGQKMMIPFFFKYGIPFQKESFTQSVIINHELNKTIIKPAGKYKFVSKSECIFTAKIKLAFFSFDDITISSNICRIRGNQVEIISRFPLSLLLLFIYAVFNLNAISGEFFELLKNSRIAYYDFIFPVAALIFAAMLYNLELKKLSKLKEELKEILSNQ